jgi:transcriptional regulator with XRE-family HTH domain
MIGVMLANERNRAGLTQEQLAAEIGVDQVDISLVENGNPGISDAKIDALFKRLNLSKAKGHAAFLKWWRANGKALTVT